MRNTSRSFGFLALCLVILSQAAFAQTTHPAEPTSVPVNNAIIPVGKLEQDNYNWDKRHQDVLDVKDRINPEIVMIGDSITHFWGGEPRGNRQNGPLAWKAAFGDRRVLNMGFGYDRTQNVLYRLDHGEFDGLHPRFVFINIGTNNLTGTKNARMNTPAEVAEAIRAICDRIKAKSPESRIIVMGVFPRGEKPENPFRPRITELNRLLAEYAKEGAVTFLDIGDKMLQPDGTIARDVMGDFTHPTEKGYAIWAEAIQKIINE